eukprot:gene29199-36321_t
MSAHGLDNGAEANTLSENNEEVAQKTTLPSYLDGFSTGSAGYAEWSLSAQQRLSTLTELDELKALRDSKIAADELAKAPCMEERMKKIYAEQEERERVGSRSSTRSSTVHHQDTHEASPKPSGLKKAGGWGALKLNVSMKSEEYTRLVRSQRETHDFQTRFAKQCEENNVTRHSAALYRFKSLLS